MGFTPCKSEQPLLGAEIQEKEEENHGKDKRESPPKNASIDSRLKAIQITGQRKAFCRQRIPELSCARNKLLT